MLASSVRCTGWPNFDERPQYRSHRLKTLARTYGTCEVKDIYLFHGDIKDNISYGLHGQIDDAAIEHAARMAELHSFIEQCPEGYDSIIGENGIKLSGGQRQH